MHVDSVDQARLVAAALGAQECDTCDVGFMGLYLHRGRLFCVYCTAEALNQDVSPVERDFWLGSESIARVRNKHAPDAYDSEIEIKRLPDGVEL